MFDLVGIKLPLLRFYSRPFYGEPVGIQSRFCQHADILLIAVVMIHSIPGGLYELGILHMFHEPVIGMYIIAFYLMGSGGRSQQKIFFKLSHL